MEFGVRELANEFGTPLYVFDLDAAWRTAQGFLDAWRSSFARFTLAYSYKTNPLPEITRELRRLGAAAEVVSGAELAWALQDGHEGRDIIFNGPVKKIDELRAACDAGVLVNLDSPQELATLSRIPQGTAPARIGVRIRAEAPGVPPMHFGMTPEEAKEIAAALERAPGARIRGIHQHIGTNVESPDAYAHAWTRVLPLARTLAANAADGLVVDVGGGFAAAPPWKDALPHAPMTAPADYAGALARALEPLTDLGARVVAEPGRCLVEPHGFLVTSVQSTKTIGERGVAILDAGVNHVPTTRMTPHPIRFEAREGERKRSWDLHGPLCMAGDVIGTNVPGPATLAVGDIVTVGNAGGYDMSGGFPWIRPHAAVVMIEGGKPRVTHRGGMASVWRG